MIKQEEAKKQTGIPPVPPRQGALNRPQSKELFKQNYEERKNTAAKTAQQVLGNG
jgi:hypothetical protein